MAFKFVTFLALVTVARAGVISGPALSYAAAPALSYAAPAQLAYAAPVTKSISYAAPAPLAYASPLAKTVVANEYDPNPQYSFSYGVSDAVTGDQKSQQESRSGDVVQGSYSLFDADGYKRTVDYTADPIQGFNAAVRREPLDVKAIAAKTVIAQPAYATYAAPVAKTISYAAPLATKTIVSQPAYATYAAPAARTISYAAPLATKTIVSQPSYATYSAPAAKTISYAAPVSYASPLATKTIVSQPSSYATYSAPLATKTIVSQQPAYATSYAAPSLYYN